MNRNGQTHKKMLSLCHHEGKSNKNKTIFTYPTAKDFLVQLHPQQEREGGEADLRSLGESANWSSLWGKIYQNKNSQGGVPIVAQWVKNLMQSP